MGWGDGAGGKLVGVVSCAGMSERGVVMERFGVVVGEVIIGRVVVWEIRSRSRIGSSDGV